MNTCTGSSSRCKFNRQLDSVCRKMGRTGVLGLHGDVATLTSNHRSRLVEYAVATRLVTADDLALLGSKDSA